MNLPVNQGQTHLPAHLQHMLTNTKLMAVNQAAAAGISSGGWPKISIKSARFRLQQPNQDELVVPQLHLDVIVVDTNPHGVSKRYYASKWDPNQEGAAPDCWSDNGVGPSSKATKPQCGTCAACPNNVWGSKISEASGKAIKACSDLKKIAVLIADNTAGPVFELDIPADSMSGFAQYARALDKHGVPMSTVITRLSFDPAASYPKLVFAPAFTQGGQLPYITVEQSQDVMDVLDTEEVDNCTGKRDVPIDPARVAAAATSTIAANMNPPMPQPVSGSVLSATPVTTPAPMPARATPLQDFATSNAAPAPGAFPQPDAAPASTPAAGGAAPKRTRRTKTTEAQAELPMAATAPVTPPMAVPPFIQGQPLPAAPSAAQAADATAPLAPSGVTNNTLDDMIRQAMGV